MWVSSFHSDQLSWAPLLAVPSQPNPIRSNDGNPTQRSFQFLDPPDPHLVADELQDDKDILENIDIDIDIDKDILENIDIDKGILENIDIDIDIDKDILGKKSIFFSRN